MSVSLNSEVRERLDAHLESVEKALMEARCVREQRRGIVDDLEAQIREMLQQRNPVPTLGDFDAVVATLDPPSAYADAARARGQAAEGSLRPMPPVVQVAETSRRPGRRLSRQALVGFFFVLASFMVMMVVLPLLLAGLWDIKHQAVRARAMELPAMENDQLAPEAAQAEEAAAERMAQQQEIWSQANQAEKKSLLAFLTGTTIALLLFPPALIGCVLGWFAYVNIKASNGTLYGRGLALLDGLFLPVMAAIGALFFAPLTVLALVMLAACVGGLWWLSRRGMGRANVALN